MSPLELTVWGSLLGLILLILGNPLRRYINSPSFIKVISKSWRDQKATGQFPDPDPLLEFDLANATARNHVYANKPLRYPYYQVRAGLFNKHNAVLKLSTDNGPPTHAHQ